MGSLDGKVAFITGAARGQGRSHAVRLAREGARIIAVDICAQVDSVAIPLATPKDLEETARLVLAEGSEIVTSIRDVRDYDGLVQAIETGIARFGRLDIAIANAGIMAVGAADPTDYSARRQIWQDTLDINLTGAWNTIEATRDAIVAAGGGSIILVSSTTGLAPASDNDVALNAYGTSKHALVALMRNTAVDLAPYNVRVNTIHPTGVATPLTENQIGQAFAARHAEGLKELWTNALPIASLSVDDISNAVIYLVTDAGRYVTGTTFAIDAGNLLR